MANFSKDRETTIPLNERVDLLDYDERGDLIHMLDYAKTNPYLHEQLYQLHANGPVWDGDVISKVNRDMLLRIGACAKVCVKGEQGFNACTYFGHRLLSIFDWLHGSLAEKGDTPKYDTLIPAEPTVRMSAAGMQVIKNTEVDHFHKYAGGIVNSVYDAMVKASRDEPKHMGPTPA